MTTSFVLYIVLAMTTCGKKHWNWNWNDSLRSNSDKFLETLEHDLDGGSGGGGGLGDRAFRRSGGYCNPMIRITRGFVPSILCTVILEYMDTQEIYAKLLKGDIFRKYLL